MFPKASAACALISILSLTSSRILRITSRICLSSSEKPRVYMAAIRDHLLKSLFDAILIRSLGLANILRLIICLAISILVMGSLLIKEKGFRVSAIGAPALTMARIGSDRRRLCCVALCIATRLILAATRTRTVNPRIRWGKPINALQVTRRGTLPPTSRGLSHPPLSVLAFTGPLRERIVAIVM